MAVIGAIILGLFYLCIAFAEFFAPYSALYEDRLASYMPPTQIHIIDSHGHPHLPFVYRTNRKYDPATMLGSYVEDKAHRVPVRFFAKGESYKLWGLVPTDLHFIGVGPGARLFLCGADQDGRDIYSRILFGGRISLTIGLVAIAITIPLGLLVGGIAGYFGGWWDRLCMGCVDSLMAIPSFYLLLALFGLTHQLEISATQRFFLITIILSLVGWTGLARVIRGQVLVIKQQEYVEASRALGGSPLWILLRHVLPQTTSWVIISASLSIPSYILGESSLSLLGLGVQPPAASWGNMLNEAMNYASLAVHPWLLAPGIAIVLAVTAFNLLGDGLRDALDRKQRI